MSAKDRAINEVHRRAISTLSNNDGTKSSHYLEQSFSVVIRGFKALYPTCGKMILLEKFFLALTQDHTYVPACFSENICLIFPRVLQDAVHGLATRKKIYSRPYYAVTSQVTEILHVHVGNQGFRERSFRPPKVHSFYSHRDFLTPCKTMDYPSFRRKSGKIIFLDVCRAQDHRLLDQRKV